MAKKPPARPDNKQDQQIRRSEIAWSGPLPPPAALEHFDRIIEGGASRILAMAEREQTHRIDTEKNAISAEIADTKRGQWLGAVITVIAVCGAIYTAIQGAHPLVSIALVGVPVLGLVKAIISGRRPSN
jgi:uncharacterized membrane protein